MSMADPATATPWPPASTPPVPPITSLAPHARRVIAGLAVHGLVVVTALVVSVDRLSALRALETGSVGLSRLEFSDQWYAITGVLEGLSYLVTGILFILWFRRAYRNLPALGAFGLRFTPGWAVGGWFVPFLNLVRPKQIADEIWRGTDPESTSTNVSGATAAAIPPLLTFWWVLFLIQAIGSTVVARLATSAEPSVGELTVEAGLNVVLEIISILGLVVAAIVVRQVTTRHDERRFRLLGGEPAPVLRRALSGLAAALVLGGIAGGAMAAASMQSDDDEPPVAAADEPETAPPSTAELDEEVLDYLHRACFNTDEQIAALKDPENLDELAAYYEQILDAVRARDAGLRAAQIPEAFRGEYEQRFLAPVEASTAEVVAAFQPIIDAARAGDAATVDQLGNAMPNTLGAAPEAADYAAEVGAGACAGSFAAAE